MSSFWSALRWYPSAYSAIFDRGIGPNAFPMERSESKSNQAK